MQEQSLFSSQLRKYLTMMLKLWPSLRLGMRHISDITQPQEHSLLPTRQYSTMPQPMFLQTVTNDMHLFIMQHDVKQEDIEDYLNDILDLLNIDEDLTLENGARVGSVRYMSREVIKVITELQQGKTDTVEKFQKNVYEPVMQMGLGDVVEQGGDDSFDQEQQQESNSEEQEQDWEQEDQMEEENNQGNQQEKTQEEKQKEKELQDDGWVIVKKKK